MQYAIIDFGSNTIRLSIYEVNKDKPSDFVQILNKKTMAGLAGYLDDEGNLNDDGINKAIEILESYKKKIKNFNVVSSHIFATAIMRKAKNQKAICKQIKNATGFEMDILSGAEEAQLGFYGAMNTIDIKKGAQIDIGGASTELVVFDGTDILFATSLTLGSLSLYLDNVTGLIPTPAEMDRIRKQVRAELETIPEIQNLTFNAISGVGGSVRAAGKIRDDWFKGSVGSKTFKVSMEEIDDIFDRAIYDPHHAMRKILQVVPDRVHTALPGIVCARTIADFFDAKSISISKYGVREGYLLVKVLDAVNI